MSYVTRNDLWTIPLGDPISLTYCSQLLGRNLVVRGYGIRSNIKEELYVFTVTFSGT